MSEADPATRREHLHELLERRERGMLVTRSREGGLRSRPMALSDVDRRETLYFVTDAASAKTAEIDRDPEVNVTFQGDRSFVSVTGRAAVLRDPQLAREIWSNSMRTWFPDGPEDPDLRIVRVEPRRAEYWDQRGPRRLRYYWEAGKAILEGREAQGAEDAGDEVHATVELAEG